MTSRYLAATVALFLGMAVYGQKWLDIPMDGKEPSFWYQWSMKNGKELGLQDLTKSSDSFHLRLWTETMVIDLFQEDDSVAGEFTLYTHSVNNSAGQEELPKSYHRTVRFNSDQCLKVLSKYDQLRIARIPDQDKIPVWVNGYDGQMYFIEVSGREHYSFR